MSRRTIATAPLDRRVSAGTQLYPKLRDLIVTAVLRPGEPLSEARVAEQFGVSRTPVREAFKRLAEEGFLRIYPQLGTFVSPIQLDAVADSQFIRETLECRAVVLATERMTSDGRKTLKDRLAAQKRSVAASDHAAFFASDEAMHADLIRIAGRPAVWHFIQGAKAQLDRVRCLAIQSQDWLRLMFEQHRTIVDAVLTDDPAAAETAMREHLKTVFAAIERIVATDQDFFEKGGGAA
ncbi:MAG TPA: GntR family transcriptional regulator [Stellaceae bacterium]|jgi:DNA-binding GntR family transcriptional regulator